MYHNFTFVETNGTKHFFRWNPTTMDYALKTRTTHQSLDGPPLVHMLDSTEVVGQMKWENAPRKRTDIYDEILGLVGKIGVLYYNEMPCLVGYKNLLHYSSYNPSLYPSGNIGTGCYTAGGYAISDGSCLAPDGISMVYAITRDTAVTTTGSGCIYTIGSGDYTLSEDNVFSCFAKERDAEQVGINVYLPTLTTSSTATFNWVSGALVPNTIPGSGYIVDFGVESVGDGWYRPWVHTTAVSMENPVGTRIEIYMYPHLEASTESFPQESTYLWGFQLEKNVKKPTWYAHTTGQPKTEPMVIEFLDIQTEYSNTFAASHHNLILNFKVIGGYL